MTCALSGFWILLLNLRPPQVLGWQKVAKPWHCGKDMRLSNNWETHLAAVCNPGLSRGR